MSLASRKKMGWVDRVYESKKNGWQGKGRTCFFFAVGLHSSLKRIVIDVCHFC
jgi:hypothetical protein